MGLEGIVDKPDKSQKRIKRFYSPRYQAAKNALDIWASYTLSRKEKSPCPTLTAIFGETAFYVKLWHNTRTNALLAQAEKPEGKQWVPFGLERVSLPSTTDNMLSTVSVMAMAIEVAMRVNMSREEWESTKTRLLWVYPRTGIYEQKRSKILDKYFEKMAWDSMHRDVLRIIHDNGITTDRLR